MKPPKLTTDSAIQAEWWECPAVVYFFGAGTPPVAVKIGVTAVTKNMSLKQAVLRRFRQIQTSNHETVELLGLIRFTEGEFPTRLAEVLERELHHRFAKLQRFAANTIAAEWFTASAELLAYIREHTEPPETLALQKIIGSPINHT